MRLGLIAAALALAATTGCSHGKSDEARIVFQSDRSGEWAMYSVRPDGSDLSRVPYEAGDYYAGLAFWSRGGERLFVPIEQREGAEALVIDMRSGARTRLPVHMLGGVAWSPDASRVVVAGERGLVLVDAYGSGRRQLTRDPNDSEPAWSPGGDRIAFVSGSSVYTVDVDGGPPKRVLREREEVYEPRWSSDGRWLAISPWDSNTGLAPLDVVRPDGTGRRRLSANADQYVWSPREPTLLYVRAGDVYRVDADGANRKRLTFDGPAWSFDRALAWSPDGERIAYVAPRLAGGIRDPRQPTDVWVMNADGSGKQAVTHAFPTGGVSLFPDWVDGEPTATPVRERARFVTLRPASLLRTRQPVGGLAARGSVAIVVQGLGSSTEFDNPPGPLLVWDRATGRADRVSVGGCGTVVNPAFAGRRLAYVCENSAIDLIAHSVHLAGAGGRMTVVATRATHLIGARFVSRLLSGVAGSGSSIVWGVADASIPVVGRWRTDRTHIWRTDGARRREIAGLKGAAWVADADAAHVVLLHGRRAVVVLSRDGRLVRRLRFGRNELVDAALDGPRVVVLTRTRLSVYGIAGGRRGRSWPLPPSARKRHIENASGALVAYVDGMAIHVVRLADGRGVVVRLPAHSAEPVYARVTAAGLFYSYTDARGLPAGRVVFVPRVELERALAGGLGGT